MHNLIGKGLRRPQMPEPTARRKRKSQNFHYRTRMFVVEDRFIAFFPYVGLSESRKPRSPAFPSRGLEICGTSTESASGADGLDNS